MATITSLGFSIFSTYDGTGTNRAQRAIRDLHGTITTAGGGLNSFTGRLSAAASAATALGPALVPIGAAAAAAGGGLAALGVTAGTALGAYGAAMKGAIDRTLKMSEAGKALTSSQKTFVSSVDGMKSAWERLIVSTQDKTLQTATLGAQGLTNVIKAMKPVIDAVHPAILKVATAFKNWTAGDGLKRFIDTVMQYGVPALDHLLNAGRNVLSFLGTGFRAFAPLGLEVAKALERGSVALKSWADGGGFQRFLEYVRTIAPQVKEFFTALWGALKNVGTALVGLGPLALGLATTLLQLIAAMPPGVIQALAIAFTVWRTAMLGAAIAIRILSVAMMTTPVGWLILGIGLLVAGIIYLATQTQFFQQLWNTVWSHVQAYATLVWNTLKTLWNGFVQGLSIAWQAVSGALVAAWNAVWNGLKIAAESVWNALKTAWNAVVGAFQVIWNTVGGALRAAWTAVWNGIRAAGQAVWNAIRTAWTAVCDAFRTVWNSVGGALRTAWTAVWNGIRTAGQAVWNAIRTAWQAVCNAFRTVWNSVGGALRTAWTTVWNAIRTAATAVWNALRTAWTAVVNALRTVGTTALNALRTAWTTVWNAIRTAGTTVWNALRTAWQAFLTALRTAWNTFSGAIKAAWNAFWTALRTAWNTFSGAIKAAWSAFFTALRTTWNTFSGAIKTAWSATWNALKSAASRVWHEIGEVIEKAINGIIGIVNKLIGGFNKVASFLKIDVKIKEIPTVNLNFAYGGMVGKPPEFAKGGVVNLRRGGFIPGFEPGRDRVPAMLSRGEGVLTPEAVKGLGGPGFVHAANKKWAGHRGAGKGAKKSWGGWGQAGEPTKGKRMGFAVGGMVPGIPHFAVGGMLKAALSKLGLLGMVSQGEYSNSVAASAGTHSGAGVVDLGTTSPAVLAKLRAAGFAAWIRTPAQGFSPHIHAVQMSNPGLSPQARAQVADYKKGGDGLGAGGGGGGGGIGDIFGDIIGKMGEILRNVALGKKPEEGLGGGGGGGFLDSVLGAVGDIFKNMMDMFTGMGSIGGQMLLSLVDGPALDKAFDWVTDLIGKFVNPAGGFGDIIKGIPKLLLDGVKKFILGKAEKAKSEVDMSALAGGGGDVQKWAPMASMALARAGISASQLPRFLALMQSESGGNPLAQNNWDSNAAIGQASRGLMQVIPSTFAAFRDPSLPNNIFDPLANMTAAARYIKSKYGGLVPGSPYAKGTNNATAGMHLVGEKGPELVTSPGYAMFGGGETVLNAKDTQSALSGGGQAAEVQATVGELTKSAEAMQEKLQAVWGAVLAKTTEAWTAMQGQTFTPMTTAMNTEVPAAGTAMQTAFSASLLKMQTDLATAWTLMRDVQFLELNTMLTVTVPTNLLALKTAWTTTWTTLQTSLAAALLAMQTAWTTSWTAMQTAATTAWTAIQTGVITPMTTALQTTIPAAATSMATGVAAAWNQLLSSTTQIWGQIKTAITDAIQAIVAPINELLKGFNNVAKAFGIDTTAPTITVALAKGGVLGRGSKKRQKGGRRGKDLRRGGTVQGYAPGRDRIPAVLSPGEGVLTPEAVRGLGGPGFVHSANRTFAGHRGAGKGAQPMGHYFALGGMALEQAAMGGMPGPDGIMRYLIGTITAQVAAGLARAGISQSLVTQGSFSTGVAASAGTHAGDGVVDLGTTSASILSQLIAAGWAAWIRTEAQGFSPHIHAVLMGATGLSPQAAAQVQSFLAGGSGLGVGSIDPNSLAGIGGIGGIDAGEVLKKVVGGDLSAVPNGMGQWVLGALTKDMITSAFASIKKKLDGADVGSGMFGEILKGMGGKLYAGVVDKIASEAAKAKAALATMVSAAGAAAIGPVPAGMAPAVLTSFWDDFQPMANGQPMNAGAIASSYLPLGSSVTVAYGGKSVTSTIQDLGPAQFVYDRHPGMAVLDLAEPMMQQLTGARSNVVTGSWKLNSVGSGRTLYGTRLRGYHMGTPGANRGWKRVGEKGPEWVKFRGGERVHKNGEWPREWKHAEKCNRDDHGPTSPPKDDTPGPQVRGDHKVEAHFHVQGNLDQSAADRIERDMLPRLQMKLQQGCGKRR